MLFLLFRYETFILCTHVITYAKVHLYYVWHVLKMVEALLFNFVLHYSVFLSLHWSLLTFKEEHNAKQTSNLLNRYLPYWMCDCIIHWVYNRIIKECVDLHILHKYIIPFGKLEGANLWQNVISMLNCFVTITFWFRWSELQLLEIELVLVEG